MRNQCMRAANLMERQPIIVLYELCFRTVHTNLFGTRLQRHQIIASGDQILLLPFVAVDNGDLYGHPVQIDDAP